MTVTVTVSVVVAVTTSVTITVTAGWMLVTIDVVVIVGPGTVVVLVLVRRTVTVPAWPVVTLKIVAVDRCVIVDVVGWATVSVERSVVVASRVLVTALVSVAVRVRVTVVVPASPTEVAIPATAPVARLGPGSPVPPAARNASTMAGTRIATSPVRLSVARMSISPPSDACRYEPAGLVSRYAGPEP